MSDNNTPDEAERLLDELLMPVDTHEAQIGRAYTIGHLLPLIRSGLALQRLESFIRCQHYMDVTIKSHSKTRFNVLIDDDDDDSTFSMAIGDRESLPEAINAALDAAGVEK